MIKYSVIVPFHSNLNLLTVCINALSKVLDFSESEIIIVDNNIEGSQIAPELEIDKKCKIISKAENLMYPRAINLGAANASGDYLIFCDADTCVAKNFHKLLVKELETDGIYGDITLDKPQWKAMIKDQVKKILKYKPEAVYVEGNVFETYPVVHALRKKHIPVLTVVQSDKKKMIMRIPSGS